MNRTLVLILSAGLLLLATALGGAWLTHRYQAAQTRAHQAEDTVASLRSQLDNAQGATETVVQYVDRVRTVEVKGATIIKEIPRYVPVQADAACPIPVGFVRLHDAAAAGEVLDPDVGGPDAAPSPVALSTVAETVAGNYTASHANAEQLTALQDALRAQGVTIIGTPAP